MRGCASLSGTTKSSSLFLTPPSASPAATLLSPSPASSTSSSSNHHCRSYSSSSSNYPLHTALGMPALSPTMSHGNLAAWHVKVGDLVAPGDALADVETDKAVLAWENQDDGYVAALLRPDGSKDIPVGAPLLILVEEEADVAKFEGYRVEEKGEGGAAAATATSAAAAAPAAAASLSSSSPARLVGPAAARVLRHAGISLSGLLATGPRGTFTKEDAIAAVSAAAKSGGAGSSSSAAKPAASPGAPAASSGAASAAAAAAASAAAAAAAPKKAATPAARAPALGALPPPRPKAEFEDIPHSQMRRVIASRLTASKAGVPHAFYRADLSALTRLRASLKKKTGKPPSVNDFVIAAAARALRSVPALNVSFDAAAASSPDARPAPSPSVDVCVAVATEGGLITPIVRGADGKGAAAISAEVADLASRARAGKLRPEEFTGGSFTISNLGMFGVSHFSAIINPPQAAILAVGGARQEAVEVEGGEEAAAAATRGASLSCLGSP